MCAATPAPAGRVADGETVGVIYRCKRCRGRGARDVFRLDLTLVRPFTWVDQHGREWQTSIYPREVPGVTCPGGCGARIYGKRVVGVYVPEVTCGAKCRGAKGPSCDCSCGGENHDCGWRL